MNPAIELSQTLRRLADRCRAARWWGALFHVGVCQDIAADVLAHEKKIRVTAQAAENFDSEALARIEEAQSPNSDGGRDITPKEMREIKPLIAKSAVLDSEAAGMAKGDSA